MSYNFDSHFVTAYKIRGDAIRKFQSNWVQIWCKNDIFSDFNFRGIVDYANVSTSKRWGSQQRVTMSDNTLDYATRRLRLRGHGKVLQFRVDSIQGKPFNIAGWATLDTANPLP
jgi:hypothetical protein